MSTFSSFALPFDNDKTVYDACQQLLTQLAALGYRGIFIVVDEDHPREYQMLHSVSVEKVGAWLTLAGCCILDGSVQRIDTVEIPLGRKQ